MIHRFAGTLFGLGLAALGAMQATAEECKPLKRYATIPFQVDAANHIMLPTTVGGVQTQMMLDTGAYWSLVRTDVSAHLNLKRKRNYNLVMFDAAGHKIDESVLVPEFRLGPLNFGSAEFFVSELWSGSAMSERGGILGQNLFTQVDLEIDNAGKTISIFSQDHCDGEGVYWADEAVILKYERTEARSRSAGTRVKRDIDKNQIDEPLVEAELAGERVTLLIDTGASYTSMDLEHARRVFGITRETPGVEKAGEVRVGSGKIVPTYSYTFPELVISGIRFEKVMVLLGDFDGDNKVILGMNELRHLRMYFAFKEGVIYVTAANAGSTATAK